MNFPKKTSFPGLLFFALGVFGLAALTGCSKEEEASIPISVSDREARPPVEKPAEELLATQDAFIEVSDKVTPSVVNIRAARTTSGRIHPLFEEFFGDLFGEQPRPQRREQSLGSGFLLTEDGYILTNEHVVAGAEEISVKLSDRREYPAKLVGTDPRTDVAVIKVETDEKLPTVVLGDSDDLQVGQWALAIGNPFGLDRTLTVGVISAKGRANVGIEEYEDFIQTDASINPGNSGGPLLNIYGEVVGINTAIVAAGQGIGFAIPINLAKLIADQLIEDGEVTRGWLGVKIQPLTQDLAESFGLERATGALVTEVIPGTPAEKAGVMRGDILLRFNGREVRGVRELKLLVASAPAGSEARVEILRGGERKTLTVEITARQGQKVAGGSPAQGEEQGWQGLYVSSAEGEGVLVESVDSGSIADEVGLRSGDVILSLGDREINSVEDFAAAVKRVKKNRPVRMLIRRGDSLMYLAFTPR
ncbi:MAG TPA: DegQ family serine endoprotease [Desulfuromonadales bacterium]|nr:DegQ family serine endoprotease [Desulfuromonadales bacterium]